MKRLIARFAIPALIVGGAVAATAAPAHAGQWFYYGFYASNDKPACVNDGKNAVASGLAAAYACNSGLRPCGVAAADTTTKMPAGIEAVASDRCGERGYKLMLFIN
ncbi:hypothetical protein [Micromonospora ureilytica]|uniref:hypothetical protein n=1 Tax=Micromonospora ureilytica TaxID=709868 RepID=UPI0040399259